MQYREANELMLTSPTEAKYIHRNQKRGIWADLNTFITNEIRKGKYPIHMKNPECHFVSELMTYGPMVLNFFMQRGYRKILFINHFNLAQKNWVLHGKNDRIFRTLPDGTICVGDPNMLFQFLPVIAKVYGFDIVIDAVLPTAPSQNRHRFLIQEVYNKYKVDFVASESQYKHAGKRINIDVATDGSRYDAVVFAGVPSITPDIDFTLESIAGQLAKYTTPDYDIIDLWGNEFHDKRFVGATPEDTAGNWSAVFMNRTAWDPTEQDLSYASDMLQESVKVFRIQQPQQQEQE